jgi:NAD(P)-dependent dehydrogenase (short-subunit alcohol dehydrogenase family)
MWLGQFEPDLAEQFQERREIETLDIGMRNVYRGSKAALNKFMRSYAARNSGTPRAMALLGGADSTATIFNFSRKSADSMRSPKDVS